MKNNSDEQLRLDCEEDAKLHWVDCELCGDEVEEQDCVLTPEGPAHESCAREAYPYEDKGDSVWPK